MPSCMRCGADLNGTAATFCPHCGMPRQDAAQYGTGRPRPASDDDYVRVGPTLLPRWLLWLLAAVLAGGGVATYMLLHAAPEASPRTVDVTPWTTPPPDPGTDPATPGYSDTPTVPYTSPDAPSPDASPTPDDAGAVVEQFYRDINNKEFGAAWELGGKNIGGASYTDWVAGYDTTANIDVSAVNAEGVGEVTAVIDATQTDGSTKVFRGTYTVSGGEIVSADITER
ncbi:hypothetical protein GCM10010211_43590 [Streptomyces albospinus]|uniref:Zinc ribbon domain-containing protein n=2 Tax=Streptomyces albospinus TaxID=285515 RepID=A0ABQ2V7U6_9ACTN|nr:hypothetical protein GCM10010211_43590 [Streptomyces albospinus]